MSIFYPQSIDFIKSKAKLLSKTFPELKLSRCQTAISVALGFKDFYDAQSKIKNTKTNFSEPDESVSDDVRIERRYLQVRAMIDYLSLSYPSADYLIRNWGLTSLSSSKIGVFNAYKDCEHDLYQLKNNEENDDIIEYYRDVEGCFPSVISDGIILAASGLKYSYFHLSLENQLKMPPYLKGGFEIYHEHEEGCFVRLAFPESFSPEAVSEAYSYAADDEPWVFEWHTGKPSPKHENILTLKDIKKIADGDKDGWFALSIRYDSENYDFKGNQVNHVVPAINGHDFIKFIESKGSLAGLNVKWFKPNSKQLVYTLLEKMTADDPLIRSNKISINSFSETLPLYASPFKRGPMHHFEFDPDSETADRPIGDENNDLN